MSAAAMRQACADSGLQCVSQELIPWGSTGLHIDTFSFIRRASQAQAKCETVVEEHAWWGAETAQARRVARLYPPQGRPAIPEPSA